MNPATDRHEGDPRLGNEPVEAERLRGATVSGARWLGVVRAASEAAALAGVVAMARLVPPSAFGRAAIAGFALALAAVLVSTTFAAGLVQRETIDRRHVETATALSLVAGLALGALTLLAALTVLPAIFDDETAQLVALASLAFPLSAIGAVPSALLQRRLEFRPLGLANLAAVLPGLIVGLVLAAAFDVDAAALVIGPLVSTGVGSLLTLVAAASWPRLHRGAAGEVLGFGAAASAGSLAYTVVRNADYATLGAVLAPAQVGFYWRAYQLGAEYQGKVSRVLMQLAFPIFARTSDREAMRRVRRRMVRLHATLLFPLIALFAATAPVAVPFVFGEAWEPAVAPAQILALVGMVAAVQTGLGAVMYAVGRPGKLALLVAADAPVLVGLVLLAAPFGIVAVACASLVNAVGYLVVSYRVLLTPYAGIPLSELGGDAGPALAGSAAVALIAAAATYGLRDAIPAPVVLFVAAAASLPVYALVLRRWFASAWGDVRFAARELLGDRLARRRPAPAVVAPS